MTTNNTKTWQKQSKTGTGQINEKKPRLKWSEMKIQYFSYNWNNIREFLLNEYGINYRKNSYARSKTKGWKNEKLEISQEAQSIAKKEVKEEMIKNYRVPAEQLNSMKKTWFDLLFAFLSWQTSKIVSQTNPETGKKEIITTWELDLQKIIRVLDKTKIEMGEPVSITEKQLWDEEKQLEKDKIKAITKVSII